MCVCVCWVGVYVNGVTVKDADVIWEIVTGIGTISATRLCFPRRRSWWLGRGLKRRLRRIILRWRIRLCRRGILSEFDAISYAVLHVGGYEDRRGYLADGADFVLREGDSCARSTSMTRDSPSGRSERWTSLAMGRSTCSTRRVMLWDI